MNLKLTIKNLKYLDRLDLLKREYFFNTGKLDVFEFDEESQLYELRESKISSGNGFIKDLLGINANNSDNYSYYLKENLRNF